MSKPPYLEYKFTGVRPFTRSLEEAGIAFVLFDADPGVEAVFAGKSEYFNRERDAIIVGKCTGSGIEAYFAEFGIRITKTYMSHIVFIYDHHPDAGEMLATADTIEEIVNQNLSSMNPADLAPREALH